MKKVLLLGLVAVGLAACCGCDRGYYKERTYTRPVAEPVQEQVAYSVPAYTDGGCGNYVPVSPCGY